MPLYGKKDSSKGTAKTTEGAIKKLGSGTALPTLSGLKEAKQAFIDAAKIDQEAITTAKLRETYHAVGEAMGANAKLGYILKGQQKLRQEALKTVGLTLQHNATVITQEAQLMQSIGRFATSSSPQILNMEATSAEFQGFNVYMKTEVEQLLKGWDTE
jgi:hypothetical protein